MSTFVLNVTTGHEEYSVNLLRSIQPFKPFYSRIWVPSKVRNYHNSLKDQAKGLPEYSLLQEPLFPGYAFVEAKEYGALLQAIRDLYIYSYIDLLGTKTGDQMELRTVLPEEQGWVEKMSSDQPIKAVFAEGRIRFVSHEREDGHGCLAWLSAGTVCEKVIRREVEKVRGPRYHPMRAAPDVHREVRRSARRGLKRSSGQGRRSLS